MIDFKTWPVRVATNAEIENWQTLVSFWKKDRQQASESETCEDRTMVTALKTCLLGS
jgi:hypothetical protein